MIGSTELFPIGFLGKPHGINGEVNFLLTEPVDPADLSCIVIAIDGINVPFFFSSVRQRGNTSYLVKLDGVETEKEVAMFANSQVYALKSDIIELLDDDENNEEGFYAEDLIGYDVKSTDSKLVGIIEDVDDTTDNVLFIIDTDLHQKVFVPVANDFIVDIDSDKRVLLLNLPDGLLELN